MLTRLAVFLCPVLACSLASAATPSDVPLLVYQGDGLTVVVLTLSEDDATVSGEIRRDGQAYPFQGRIEEDDDAEVVRGTFVAGGESFDFVTRQQQDSDTIMFMTGGRQYTLRPVVPAPSPPAGAKAPVNPLGRAEGAPVQAPPPAPRPTAARPPASQKPPTMKLKRHAFRDVSMGNVVSHTMLIPEDWTAEGQIQWTTGDNAFPQPQIVIRSPKNAKVAFIPAMTFAYTEVNPVPGFAPIPPQGTPPPRSIGDWVVSVVRENNRKVSDVRLIDDRRDPQAEAASEQLARQMGSDRTGIQEEIHVVTIGYRENGVAMQDQITLSYVRYQPIVNENIRSQMWSVFTSRIIGAPEAEFEALKPTLDFVASTYQPTAKWFTQYHEVRMELIRLRGEAQLEAIRRRGQMYDQMSDAQHERFRKHMTDMDKAQEKRIDAIYEVGSFTDTDGSSVKLPYHYKHAYSDGNGNFVMTDNADQTPGQGWTEIHPRN